MPTTVPRNSFSLPCVCLCLLCYLIIQMIRTAKERYVKKERGPGLWGGSRRPTRQRRGTVVMAACGKKQFPECWPARAAHSQSGSIPLDHNRHYYVSTVLVV